MKIKGNTIKDHGFFTRDLSINLKIGVFVISFGILVLITVGWFLKLPEKASGQILLHSEEFDNKIFSQGSGKAILLKKNKAYVSAAEVVGFIESDLDFEEGLKLLQTLESLDRKNLDYNLLARLNQYKKLGPTQTTLNRVLQLMSEYERTMQDQEFQVKVNQTQKVLEELDALLHLELARKTMTSNRLALMNKGFKRDSTLNQNLVISKSTLEGTRMQLIDMQLMENDVEKGVRNLRSRIVETKMQIDLLIASKEESLKKLRYEISNSIDALRNDLRSWENKFVFKSRNAGTLYLNQELLVMNVVNYQDMIGIVKPQEEDKIVGLLSISVGNKRKIQVGQKVKISLVDYPVEQYGYIEGHVSSISPRPFKDNFQLTVDLASDDLVTSQDIEIEYEQDMMGAADIIIERKSLIERFLESAKKILHNKNVMS